MFIKSNFSSIQLLAQYNIQRTCTSKIKINMFMVDRVCMSESNHRGRLCFCEDISCNSATKNHHHVPSFSISKILSQQKFERIAEFIIKCGMISVIAN